VKWQLPSIFNQQQLNTAAPRGPHELMNSTEQAGCRNTPVFVTFYIICDFCLFVTFLDRPAPACPSVHNKEPHPEVCMPPLHNALHALLGSNFDGPDLGCGQVTQLPVSGMGRDKL
jgi:hypothetical protein